MNSYHQYLFSNVNINGTQLTNYRKPFTISANYYIPLLTILGPITEYKPQLQSKTQKMVDISRYLQQEYQCYYTFPAKLLSNPQSCWCFLYF